MSRTGRPPGRPPTPPALKVVRGTAAKQTAGPAGDKLDGIPPVPDGIGDAGRSAWELYWRHGGSWLAETDRPLIERLCRLIHDAAELRATIEAEGLTVQNQKTGRSHVHALYNSLLGLEKSITSLEAACGFTPADRGRLRFAPEVEDPLSRWERGEVAP